MKPRSKKTIAARRKVRAYKAAQVPQGWHRVFKVGDRVFMPADRDEGWDAETGTIVDVQPKGIVTIMLDPEFWADQYDDGIRETGAEFCRRLPKAGK